MQPNATNRPRIAPGRNQTGTHPNLTPKQSTQNIRTAILTAIFTIELNCNKIAKPQRIARGLKGLHQNPGKSTNCKKTSPIAPESAYFRNRSGIRVRSTQNRGNAGTMFCNPGNCGGIADSRQSNCSPVWRHPTGHRIAIDPELSVFCYPCQIAAQSTQKRPQSTQSNWIAIGLQN